MNPIERAHHVRNQMPAEGLFMDKSWRVAPQAFALSPAHVELKGHVPAVIRPDLILTEDAFALSELDSVPGGIGLTSWLNQTYSALGDNMLGGADGMRRGFESILN